jgi:serine/threonine-protein kinase RsbW
MRPQQLGPAESRNGGSPRAVHDGLGGPFALELPATLSAPAAARAAVGAWMAGHVSDAMLVDIRLLLGELVTNSLLHADGPGDAVIKVRAEVRADVLWLEVADRGSTGEIERQAPDQRDRGGFGLNVVDVVSRRWGVDRDAGTRVWAELAFQPAG